MITSGPAEDDEKLKDEERERQEKADEEQNSKAYNEYISEGKEKPNYPNFVRAKEGFTYGGQQSSGSASPQRAGTPVFTDTKRYRSLSPEIQINLLPQVMGALGAVDEVEAIVKKNVRRLSEDFDDFESKEKLPNHRVDKRQRSFSPFKKGPSSTVP